MKIKVSELSYYLFFSILLFAKGIGLYDGQLLFKTALLAAGACWLVKMFMTPYSKKEAFTVLGLLLLSAVIYGVSGEKGLLLYVMMVVGVKNIPVKRLLVVGLAVWSVSFGSLFFLAASRIVDSPFKVHRRGAELIIRWGLGYSHPNVLHVSYLLLCLLIGYLLADQMKMKWLLLMMLGNLYTFLYSVSFTGFIAVTFYLVLCGYWMYRKKIGEAEKILIGAGAVFCVLFSMLAPILLQGQIYQFVNRLLNTRLRLSRYFLTNWPVSLLGQRLSEITNSTVTMDNSYVFAYVVYGIIVFVLLVSAYGVIIRRYCKQQKGSELCVILAILAAGVTEPFLFNTSFKNISMIFLGELLFSGEAAVQDQICIGGKFDRTIDLPVRFFTDKGIWLKQFVKDKILLIAGCILTGFIAGAAVSLLAAQRPARIVVPRSLSDLDETWYVELNLEEDQIEDTDVVLGSAGQGELWLGLTGTAIELERWRDLVSAGVWTAGILFVVVTGVCYHKDKNLSEGQGH